MQTLTKQVKKKTTCPTIIFKSPTVKILYKYIKATSSVMV